MNTGQLFDLFQAGRASPLEAVQAALERIERFNPVVNAYTHVDREGAERAARDSTQRWTRGEPLSTIDGMSVSLKDLTEVAGMPARKGSRTVADTPCNKDAPVARMLREAGAILLGKTNTPEFGWKGLTDNRVYGTTCNPWNTRLTPGGSSGGAAVAAALNMGVLHQGGDSGGSIRIPAAFTGVFGFKPTFGWIPQWPPANEPTLSHLGPLTRSVPDAVRMLNVIGRYDYRDPYMIRGMPDDWGMNLDQGLNGLRIAYSPDLGYATVDEQVAQRVREAARALEALGAEVVEVDPGFESPLETFQTLWFTASLEAWTQCDERQRLDPGMVATAMRARDFSALDLFQAVKARARLAARLEYFNQQYHLLMTPTVPIAPFETGHDVPPGSGLRDWEEWSPFTYPFNLTQQPAASVPCGFTDVGLPVGFQLAGGKFDDVRILRACHAYLSAHPPRFPSGPSPARPD
nr:amidase [Halomonas populi]